MLENTLLIGEGFLPNRASLMLDFVFLAMLVVLPIQAFSFWIVKYQRKLVAHRSLQVGTAAVLLVTVLAFEIDMQIFTDWRALAKDSRFYDSGWVDRLLWIHLAFAIPTPFVWGWVIFAAIKNFTWQVTINEYASKHRQWGRVAALFLMMTSITGWVFYLAAFVL